MQRPLLVCRGGWNRRRRLPEYRRNSVRLHRSGQRFIWPSSRRMHRGIGPYRQSSTNVRYWRIPLKKPSSFPFDGKLAFWRKVVWAALGPPCGALCGQHFRKHIHWSQSGQAPQVLGGGGEEKFVAGAVLTPDAQAGQSKDALEMGEQHLDLLPTTAGLLVLRRCGKRT